ncbi:hypothetical protein EJ03DRAFT_334877 [Teratosphaeria nubilosa]|uniref:Uncharacterized protein n=1 Tax=Teratosphaeria nubilosa TaxID=161662 RepID=A0A6G1LF19_9PEZI|nr:hypothetical protein EJ03DRAFT_334877 [Teratosphaeria nubilosa]
MLLVDAEIVVTDEDMPARRRRWHREVARLKDPESRPPPKRVIPAALTVCSRFHDAVAEAFWRQTTVVIETFHHLHGFLQTQPGQIAAANLRSLTFGSKQGWWEYTKNQPETDQPETEFIDRPASLDMFLPFRKLKRLELCHDALVPVYGTLDLPALLTEQELARARPAWCQREAAFEHGLITGIEDPHCDYQRDRYYLRDHILMTIPDTIINQLETLSMYYKASHPGGKDLTADVLDYAKDLRAGAWSLDEATGLARCGRFSSVSLKSDRATGSGQERSAPLRRKALQLWIEARAAVHWVATGDATDGVTASSQWCTWSREWERWAHVVWRQRQPRTYEELFAADGTVKEGIALIQAI